MWLFPQQLLHLLVSLIIVLQSPFSCRGFDPFISRLAVDYGPRLIGVAASFGRNIQPLITIPHCGNLTILSGEIINLARSKGAVEIIVGVPLDRDGRMKYTVRNLNGILSLNFSSVLAAQCIRAYPRAQVLIMDERYTTREAREKSKEEYPRASIDAVSAACLLERYLEDEGCFNTLPALPSPFPLHKDLEMFDYNIIRRHIRLTKYANSNDPISSGERLQMRKFGVFRASKDSEEDNEESTNNEEVELDHAYYSFNAREYFRLKALNTKALNADLIPQTEAELTDESGEESEEDRQYRIRALRRKRGTLRR